MVEILRSPRRSHLVLNGNGFTEKILGKLNSKIQVSASTGLGRTQEVLHWCRFSLLLDKIVAIFGFICFPVGKVLAMQA